MAQHPRPKGQPSEGAADLPATTPAPEISPPTQADEAAPSQTEPQLDTAWAEPERRPHRKTSLPSGKHAPTPATLASPSEPAPPRSTAGSSASDPAALLAQLQQTILLQALLGESHGETLPREEAERVLRQRLTNMNADQLTAIARSFGLDPTTAAPPPSPKVRKRVIGPAVPGSSAPSSSLPEVLAPDSLSAVQATSPASSTALPSTPVSAAPLSAPSPAASRPSSSSSASSASGSSWGPLQTGAAQVDQRVRAKNLVVHLTGEIPLLGRLLVRAGQWRLGFFLSFTALLLAGGLAAVGFMTWRSSRLAEERAAEAAETPAAQTVEAADAQAIRDTLRGYYIAQSWEELLPWVREPDLVRPMMENHYRRTPFGPPNRDIEILQLVRSKSGDLPCVYALVLLHPSLERKSVLLFEGEHQTYKIDWETEVVYQFMDWATFQETRPADPVPFRVTVRESDYYNFEFADDGRYRSWIVYDPQRGVRLFGYTERDGPADRQLVGIIAAKGTGRTAAILRLAYPEGTSNPEQVLITEVGSVSWMIDYDAFR